MIGELAKCLSCGDEKYWHRRHVGVGLPPACMKDGCRCWAFELTKDDESASTR